MAQRRMSRKSFRKSKGRKTRSMRKRTMGGEDVFDSDEISVLESVKTENTAAYSDRMSTIGKCTKKFGYKNSMDRTDANKCELYKMADLALQGKMTEADEKASGVKFSEKGPDRKDTGRYFSPYSSVKDYLAKTATKTTTEPAPEPATTSPEAERIAASKAQEELDAKKKLEIEAKKLELEKSIQELQVKTERGEFKPVDEFTTGYLQNFIDKVQEKYGENFTPNTNIARDQLVGALLLKHKDIIEAENYKRLAPPFQKFTINDLNADTRIKALVKILDGFEYNAQAQAPAGGRKTRRRRNKKSRKTRRR